MCSSIIPKEQLKKVNNFLSKNRLILVGEIESKDAKTNISDDE